MKTVALHYIYLHFTQNTLQSRSMNTPYTSTFIDIVFIFQIFIFAYMIV